MNRSIMIIDDSRDNRDLLKQILSSSGFDAHCAPNGKEALSLMKQSRELPALILLDAQMPVMDGYQFRIEQEKDARLKDIPVVVMTGDSDPNMHSEMRQPRGIMMKPLNFQSVVDGVNMCLSAKSFEG